MLQELLASDREQRILVTAPTHNAVDNVMHKYITRTERLPGRINPIRVSTDVSYEHNSGVRDRLTCALGSESSGEAQKLHM